MYIVSFFREGVQQLNQIYFIVIVFESQKLPLLKGSRRGERKVRVWKVDGRVWNGCRRCAADRSRHAINPRNGGQ